MTSSDNGRITVRIDADIEDLIPGFLENRQKDVREMKEALDRGDYTVIQKLGHSMKGAGGGYGFDGITDIGRSLEEAVRAGNIDGIRNAVDELASYLDRIDIVYEEA